MASNDTRSEAPNTEQANDDLVLRIVEERISEEYLRKQDESYRRFSGSTGAVSTAAEVELNANADLSSIGPPIESLGSIPNIGQHHPGDEVATTEFLEAEFPSPRATDEQIVEVQFVEQHGEASIETNSTGSDEGGSNNEQANDDLVMRIVEEGISEEYLRKQDASHRRFSGSTGAVSTAAEVESAANADLSLNGPYDEGSTAPPPTICAPRLESKEAMPNQLPQLDIEIGRKGRRLSECEESTTLGAIAVGPRGSFALPPLESLGSIPNIGQHHPGDEVATTQNLEAEFPSPRATEEQIVEAQLVEQNGEAAIESNNTDSDEDGSSQHVVVGKAVQESKLSRRFSLFGLEVSVNCFILLILAALLLVGIIVISAVTTLNTSTTVVQQPPESSATENRPSSPTHQLNHTKFERLKGILITSGATVDKSLFDDPSSAQYKALTWLAEKDQVQLIIDDNDSRILQRYVLAVLYFSTDGPNWTHQHNFLSTDKHECLWNAKDEHEKEKGVLECNVNWGREITKLSLYWNNLNGTIPEELSALTSLREISIAINELRGTIPASLAQLPYLGALFVNNNILTGTVPTELATLPKLTVLGLHENPYLEANLESFCNKQALLFFVSDCGGDAPTASCPCCTKCCDREAKQCCDNPLTEDAECWDPTPVLHPFGS